jgi:hypothetical protein
MEVTITTKTKKGQRPTFEALEKSLQEAFNIAHKLNGMIVGGKGMKNGTQVVVQL